MTNEKNKYLTIFESHPNPVILVNKANRMDNVNHAAAMLFGSSSVPGFQYYCATGDRLNEALEDKAADEPAWCGRGKRVDEVLAWLSPELERFSESEAAVTSFIKKISDKKGLRFYGVKLSRMEDFSGKFSGTIIHVEDLTPQKQAEEEMKKSKELFEKIFQSQRDAIFILDSEMPPKITDCNPSATRLFKYSFDEMRGSSVELLHVNNQKMDDFHEMLYRGIKDRGFFYLDDFRMRRKNGVVFPTENTVVELIDKDGLRMGWISVVRDISKRKRGEKEAMEKERLQGVLEMAGAICHELNQPLQALYGYSQLLMMDIDDQHPLYDRISKIEHQVERVAAITGKLSETTRYKTKDYLNGKIIDIAKATDMEAP
jgi:PAS domain S-box-containing protein